MNNDEHSTRNPTFFGCPFYSMWGMPQYFQMISQASWVDVIPCMAYGNVPIRSAAVTDAGEDLWFLWPSNQF